MKSPSLDSATLRLKVSNRLNRNIRGLLLNVSKLSPIKTKLQIEVMQFGFIFLGNYYSTHNAGLFSIVSTIASDLSKTQIQPKRISFKFCGHYYKNYFFENPWRKLFDHPNEGSCCMSESHLISRVHDWWDKDYAELNLDYVVEFSNKYLRPSLETSKALNLLCEKYGLVHEETLTVHYRGTDKASEIALVDVREYILRIRELLQELTGLNVLILTDDSQAYEMFLEAFPASKSLVNELPTSKGGLGAHEAMKVDRTQDAIFYLASVLIASKSKILVTHTGNGGLGERIFRGAGEGFIQMR